MSSRRRSLVFRIIQDENSVIRMNSERESLVFTIVNTDVVESSNIKSKLRKRESGL